MDSERVPQAGGGAAVERPTPAERPPTRFGPGPGGDRPRPDGPGGDRPSRFDGGERSGGFRGRGGGRGRGGPGRRKQPIYADNEIVDYKDIARLRLAIDERGKILPRRKTHCSAHIQRQITVAIKRARHLALLPFVPVDRRR